MLAGAGMPELGGTMVGSVSVLSDSPQEYNKTDRMATAAKTFIKTIGDEAQK
jgi:hypothetical protein